MTKTKLAYEPDYAVPPGETLRETIAALGMDQKQLATRLGFSEKHISLIMKGGAPLTYETADKLELVTGVPARVWNNLEMNYRQRLVKIEATEKLASDADWLRRVPTKELVERGKIPAGGGIADCLRGVLAFFGVSSVQAWEDVWLKPATAFRRSPCFEMKPEAMATWLRLGELEAQQIDCGPFDRAKFLSALNEIRKLTTKTPAEYQQRMVELCAAAGVAVVFVPEIKGCPASGASRWLSPDKALIQLSLRHKTDDHFWFSFFHEAGHILHDPKKGIHIADGSKESKERESKEEERESKADEFARNMLIPPDRKPELAGLRTAEDVCRFAASVGIAPGIVVGRLHHDRVIHYSRLQELRQRLEWAE